MAWRSLPWTGCSLPFLALSGEERDVCPGIMESAWDSRSDDFSTFLSFGETLNLHPSPSLQEIYISRLFSLMVFLADDFVKPGPTVDENTARFFAISLRSASFFFF